MEVSQTSKELETGKINYIYYQVLLSLKLIRSKKLELHQPLISVQSGHLLKVSIGPTGIL